MARWIKIVEDSGVTTVVNVDTVTGITHYPHRNPHHNMFEIYIPGGKIEFRERDSPEGYKIIEQYMKELEHMATATS